MSRSSGLLHGFAEAFDGAFIGIGDDLAQLIARFGFRVADDGEPVESETDLSVVGAGHLGDVVVLFAESVEVLAVGEVPVGVLAAVDAGDRGVSALEDLRVRATFYRVGAGRRVKSSTV